ncbi:30S ribosomal protein S18 [Streptomyces sp. NPDC037389]|uniref:30S ribosomal protein S18 n=1 Tax=Streptomyces sp. NPDC037389 TaxID=3155369 RepID=UPI0033EC31E1
MGNRPDAPKHRDKRRDKPTRTPRRNPLDAAGITYIDYKDTDLLRKFISDRGKIRSRRVTRVTVRQQRQLTRAIKNAREMALLPYSGASPDGRSSSGKKP